MIMLQYISSQVLVLISEHLSYFKVLYISKRFYFPSAFIFRALLFSERFYFPSAFIFRALLSFELFYFSFERFYFYFFFASQRLFFILLSMKQCPIFVSKTVSWSYFFIIFWITFEYVSNASSNYVQNFQVLTACFLIMYKTSRFWPLV